MVELDWFDYMRLYEEREGCMYCIGNSGSMIELTRYDGGHRVGLFNPDQLYHFFKGLWHFSSYAKGLDEKKAYTELDRLCGDLDELYIDWKVLDSDMNRVETICYMNSYFER